MWSSPPSTLQLNTDQIHVWMVDVPSNKVNEVAFFSLLSKDEKERANRFRFEKDRLIYVTAKAILRKLIGQYLNIDPTNIIFQYYKKGKPYINSKEDLKFNVSHSGDKVLIGFSLQHEMGVDIEYNKRKVKLKEVAKRFFSQTEYEKMVQLPKSQWRTAFFNCWTRKEAFIKAKGGGLSIPLDQFEVTLIPNEKPALQIIRWDQEDVPNWDLQTFDYETDYTGATIVHQPGLEYKWFKWD